MTVTVTTNGIISLTQDTNLTLAQIVSNVCMEIGVTAPDTIVGNSDRTAVELLYTAEKACEECARRVDWGGLIATAQFTGTGQDTEFTLPDGFLRLTQGAAVSLNNTPIRGSLTSDEWLRVTKAVGTPKYFRLRGNTISFSPWLSATDTVDVEYITKYYTSQTLDYFQADDDRITIPHQVIEKCMIYRWRRTRGEDFEDYFAEFEAALVDYANFDIRDRTPNVG